VELDPVKRAALLIRCNEMVIENFVVIPLVMRPSAVAAASNLVLEISGWDNNTWDLANWYRES
jgi:peptide/nickel transport system substrate-binding protein